MSLADPIPTHTVVIRFQQADPAGLLFFAQVYAMAHEAYEQFVSVLGFQKADWFNHPEWAVPIRQSSCEHLAPMRFGDEIRIEARIEKIGESSFTMRYSFHDSSTSKLMAEVRLIHVFIHKSQGGKIPIPSVVRDRLEAQLLKQAPA